MGNSKEAAYKEADELRELIKQRTGLRPSQLQCPREKSDMTPCIARDGGLAVAFDEGLPSQGIKRHRAICVGCETDVSYQLKRERAKHA